MSAQICFVTICYNADSFLEPVLESIIPFAPVVCVEGPVKFFTDRGAVTSSDKTNEILHAMLPANMILHGQFAEKDAMMRAAEHMIPRDTTHVWMVDSDELIPRSLIERVLGDLDGLDSAEFKPHTFFGGFQRTLTGFELRSKWQRVQRWHPGAHWQSHRPPTVLAPDGQPYHTKRHAAYLDERFFHYSYCFPKQVKEKIQYYESWNAGTIPDYFNAVYLRWVRGDAWERERVETEYQGVHEFLPARRGNCYTVEFTGAHPPAIAKRMPELLARFERELAEV